MALEKIGLEEIARFESAAIQATPFQVNQLLYHTSYYYSYLPEILGVLRVGVLHAVPQLLEAGDYTAENLLVKIGSAAVPALLAQAALSSELKIWEMVESVVVSIGEEARPALRAHL